MIIHQKLFLYQKERADKVQTERYEYIGNLFGAEKL